MKFRRDVAADGTTAINSDGLTYDLQKLVEKANLKAKDSNGKIIINNLVSTIVDLSYSLKNHNSNLSLDTHNKMKIYRDSRIQLLESYVIGTIEVDNLGSKLTSDDLAITQTDRRRFLACSLALLYFDDNHPIKRVFMDVINFQRIIAADMPYQYSQILGNFKKNLELMPKIQLKHIEVPEDKIIEQIKLEHIINGFITEEDLDKAFINLQHAICALTDKEEPGIDDLIDIYYQIACLGVNNYQFLFKFLTTCEGIDTYEQDKFINITYIKTSILTMMQTLN